MPILSIRAPIGAVRLLLWMAVVLAADGCTGPSRPLAIEGVTVVPRAAAPDVPGATVLIEEGRIRCIGPENECPVPAGAIRFPADGMWLLPGLIDTHTHPAWSTDRNRTWGEERLRFLFGVTTTRDASTSAQLEANLATRELAADPGTPIPRLVVAGRLYGDSARDEGTAREEVSRLAALGVDAIKVKEPLEPSIYAAIVEAAREHGLDVYGHMWGEDPPRSAVASALHAGVGGYSHLMGFPPLAVDSLALAAAPTPVRSDAWKIWRRTLWADADPDSMARVARALAESGAWIEPLLLSDELWSRPYHIPLPLVRMFEVPLAARLLLADRRPSPTTDEERVRLGVSLERTRRFLRDFAGAGGTVIVGSDGSLMPGLSVHEEMRALVDGGLTPAQALSAATEDAARVLGVSDSLGRIEPGMVADLVLLEADPREDIRNTLRLVRVIKGGRVYDPVVLRDELAGSPEVTDSSRRWWVAVLALLVTLAAFGYLVGTHRDRLRHEGR